MCDKQKETHEKLVRFILRYWKKAYLKRDTRILQHFNTSLKGDAIFCDEKKKIMPVFILLLQNLTCRIALQL